MTARITLVTIAIVLALSLTVSCSSLVPQQGNSAPSSAAPSTTQKPAATSPATSPTTPAKASLKLVSAGGQEASGFSVAPGGELIMRVQAFPGAPFLVDWKDSTGKSTTNSPDMEFDLTPNTTGTYNLRMKFSKLMPAGQYKLRIYLDGYGRPEANATVSVAGSPVTLPDPTPVKRDVIDLSFSEWWLWGDKFGSKSEKIAGNIADYTAYDAIAFMYRVKNAGPDAVDFRTYHTWVPINISVNGKLTSQTVTFSPDSTDNVMRAGQTGTGAFQLGLLNLLSGQHTVKLKVNYFNTDTIDLKESNPNNNELTYQFTIKK
jgi:hypothetical protein